MLNDLVCEGEDAGVSSKGGTSVLVVRHAGVRRGLELEITSILVFIHAPAEFCKHFGWNFRYLYIFGYATMKSSHEKYSNQENNRYFHSV